MRPFVLLVSLGLITAADSLGEESADAARSGNVRSSLGVNIHFTGAPARDLDMIRDGGFGWVRMDFVWSSVEREQGVYRFEPYDQLVDGLAARSIRALFILDYSNRLYEKSRSVTTAAGRRAFSRFAAAAAARYRGRGVRWEIWNEPNLEGFWKPQPAADDYAQLVIETAKAIRAVDPGAVILGPASSGFPWPFLERIFELGVLEHLNEVSVHPYRALAPETVREEYARLRRLIERHRPSRRRALPIVSGEWGYSTYHHGGIPMTPETQAKYLAREFLTNLSESIPLSIWYDWANDGTDPKETEHNFGTVTHDRRPKPAYEAARTLTGVLGKGRFERRLEISPEDHLLLFAVSEKKVLVGWTTGAPHDLTLQALGAPSSLQVRGYRGGENQVPQRDGAFDLPLDDAPKYVALPFSISELTIHGLDVEPLGGGKALFTVIREGPGAENVRLETEIGSSTTTSAMVFDGRRSARVVATAPPRSGKPYRVAGRLSDATTGRRLASWPERRFADVPAFVEESAERPFAHLSAVLDGDARVEGEASLSSAPPEEVQVAAGARLRLPTLRLDYRFARGWKFVRVVTSRHKSIAGRPSALSLVVRGDGSGNLLRCRFRDAKGETFQPTAGRISWTGWRRVEFPLDGREAGHWGGDGRIDYPIQWDSVVLVDSTRKAGEGSVDFRSPVLIYPGE